LIKLKLKKLNILLGLVLISIYGCGVGKKQEIQRVKNATFIKLIKEIKSQQYGFKNAKFDEATRQFVFTDESSRKLFIAAKSKEIKLVFKGNIRSVILKDSLGFYFINKSVSKYPTFQIYFYSFGNNGIKKIFETKNSLQNFQLVELNRLFILENASPLIIDCNNNKVEKFKNLKFLHYFVLIFLNSLKIFNEGKMFEYDFRKGNRIIWNSSNYYKKETVAYVATKGAILFKNGIKINLGKLEHPVIDPSGDFVAGIKSYYGNNRLLNSKLIIFNISGHNPRLIFQKLLNNLTEINWSSKGKYIVGTDIEGKIILFKIRVNR